MFFLRRSYSHKTSSALGERFQQILDEKLATSNLSSVSNNPELAKAYESDGSLKEEKITNSAKQRAFEQKYQREIELIKSQSKYQNGGKLQLDVPWNASEKFSDTASRMLLDSLPKAKPTRNQARIFSPAVGLKDRIEGAKEGALDYKIKPHTDKEREDFRELYKERLLGPSMFVDTSSPKATLGLIGGLADSQINAAIDRKTGKFESRDMETVRGKPLDKARLANCLDTNFFLNEILNKQECLPPWIENQQGVEREVSQFRNELNKALFLMMLDTLRSRCEDNNTKIAALMKEDGVGVCEKVKSRYLQEHSRYFSAKVQDLNRGIRNYNLQCPTGALHKWKIVEDKELADRLKQLLADFETLFEEYRKRRESKPPLSAAPAKPFFFIRRKTIKNEMGAAAGSSTSLWDSITSRFRS